MSRVASVHHLEMVKFLCTGACIIIALSLFNTSDAYTLDQSGVTARGVSAISMSNGYNRNSNNEISIHKTIQKKNNFKIDISAYSQTRLQQSKVTTVNNDDDTYAKDVKTTAAWVAAALGFGGIVASTKGADASLQYFAGYALEQSLSVDNLFVFLLLFDYFKVDKSSQDKILQYGFLGAIVLRGLFIGAGTVVLAQFHQVLLLFAGVLFFSSYGILFGGGDEEEEDFENNPIINFAKKYLRSTDKRDGDNFFTTINGEKFATPLLLCLVCVELSDIVFAFDSVPAIFGVTQDPFIIFSSNIFAIAGLRSLFTVLSRAVSQLEYLEKSVGLILALIGAKLTAETFDIELLNPLQSLLIVLGLLGGGVALSLLNKNKEE